MKILFVSAYSEVLKTFIPLINHFTNNTSGPRRVTLVQNTPGNVRTVELKGQEYCLQPGAFIACTP